MAEGSSIVPLNNSVTRAQAPPDVADAAVCDAVTLDALRPLGNSGKPRVVVLGSGWGAMTFLKDLKPGAYEVVVVSPRNYFLYTPLLPASATGAVEDRSIVEPVRKQFASKGFAYVQAKALHIDPKKRTVSCSAGSSAGGAGCEFELEYDYLVNAVGSVPNTFGTPGVEENAIFFKEVTHAVELRQRVLLALERASLPGTSVETARELLTFTIVGGGPTGVELAGELYDLLREDVAKEYPKDLMELVKVVIVELQDHILSMYDRKISEYATDQFKRRSAGKNFEVKLNSLVKAVEPNRLIIADKVTGEESAIPFGACVWSTGIKMHPLCEELKQTLCDDDPESCPANIRSLATDKSLRVKGTAAGGRIFALGDCATVERPLALEAAKRLFCGGKSDEQCSAFLDKEQLLEVLTAGAKDFPHLGEIANAIDKEWDGIRGDQEKVGFQAFTQMLERADNNLRAFPATAQVAKQEGQHLASVFNSSAADPQSMATDPNLARFDYNDKGSLAYIGADNAVMDITGVGQLKGFAVGYLWRGFETISQISLRNAVLVAGDWVYAKLFGRCTSRLLDVDVLPIKEDVGEPLETVSAK